MSFPRYPSYKDSGVEWLGAVPGHWLVTKTKHVVQFTTGWTPPTGESASYEGANLWANISDLGPKYLLDTAKRVSDDAIAASRMSVSPKGSLMFSFKLSIGQVSFAGQDMFTNEAIATFLPSSHLSLDFAYYAFPLLLVQNAAENIYGAKLLNQELIRSASFALPSFPEQTQIAAFLDRETAKIDKLVAEQRRLMELLKEKRQAVISHAVTQGLNPDAPMKPSGIEWLGDVPAHWEVWPLGRTASDIDSLFIDGDWIESKDLSDVGIRYLTSGNVGEGIYKEQGQGFISQATFDELNCIEVLPGDVLISRLNLPIGRACIVPDLDSRIVTCVDNVIVRPNRNFDRRFFVFLLTSKAHFANMEILARGTTMQRISRSTLAHVRFAFPPETEQTQIAAFLDAETAKLDTLTAETQRAIDLLQERRTALISAAVTGQIDVRGIQALPQ